MAPRPIATLKTSGTAMPRAHGQVTMSSVVAWSRPDATPAGSQSRNVTVAATRMPRVNHAPTRSVKCTIWGLRPALSATSCMSRPARVSLPAAVTRTRTMAPTFTVPA